MADINPGCGLPRKIPAETVDRFTIRQPLESLQHITVATARAGTVGRPTLDRIYKSGKYSSPNSR